MVEKTDPVPLLKLRNEKSRPVLFTILFIFSWIYYGVLSLLFLLAVFYSGTITEVVNLYASIDPFSQKIVLLPILLGGFIFHIIAFTGTLLMWHHRRWGYFPFAISTLVIASYQLFQPGVAVTTTGIYIILLLLFGIVNRRKA